MTQQKLMYIELKTGYSDNGPAWISNVQFSKSRTTVYSNGKALKRMHGGGISGNFFDLESGAEYWVSGVKKKENNRHWAGSGKILIDIRVVDEFLQYIGKTELDRSHFEICGDIVESDITKFHEEENKKFN